MTYNRLFLLVMIVLFEKFPQNKCVVYFGIPRGKKQSDIFILHRRQKRAGRAVLAFFGFGPLFLEGSNAVMSGMKAC